MTPVKESSSERAMSLMAGEERRRSQRVIIRVPVILELMVEGEKVTAPAITVAVNIHGAMLLCASTFDAETVMQIRNERSRDRAGARVTRAPRESAEGFLIPLEFTEPSPNFWQITFPPSNWKSSDG
jgi:hypothetical protein